MPENPRSGFLTLPGTVDRHGTRQGTLVGARTKGGLTMRKKIATNRFIPRAPLGEELRPDWLSSAAVLRPKEGDGATVERSLHIAG